MSANPANAPQGAMVRVPQGFEQASRNKRTILPSQSKTTSGQLLQWQIPRTGFLRGIPISFAMTVAGTLTLPNPAGFTSIIKQVRLTANAGFDIINISGPGYHYLLRDRLELKQDIGSYTTARSAITATTCTLDMYLPVTVNRRDPVSLLNLQTEQNTYTLSVLFEVDNPTVATGATVTGTVTPALDVFSVPSDPANYPADDVIHRILEESVVYPSGGQQIYYPIRQDIYLGLYLGVGGDVVAAADNYTAAQIRLNQSDVVYDTVPALDNIIRGVDGLTARRAGVLGWDFMASAGLGDYDKLRDTIDSGKVSDFAALTTLSAAGTVRYMRRLLSRING